MWANIPNEDMAGRKLILFDIDGTLLTTNGRGRDAFRSAIESAFGKPFDAGKISFSGKTDQQILGEILSLMGIDDGPEHPKWNETLDMYRSLMVSHLRPEDVIILPGVEDLLKGLRAHPSVQLGLLTGNLRETAYLKLGHARLDAFFPFGAFGCDHADRYRLPLIAVERARLYSGWSFDFENVIVVGDTEHDIGCAKGVSATSVAVCTGVFTRAELEQFEPNFLFDDLSDTSIFMESVVNGSPA